MIYVPRVSASARAPPCPAVLYHGTVLRDVLRTFDSIGCFTDRNALLHRSAATAGARAVSRCLRSSEVPTILVLNPNLTFGKPRYVVPSRAREAGVDLWELDYLSGDSCVIEPRSYCCHDEESRMLHWIQKVDQSGYLLLGMTRDEVVRSNERILKAGVRVTGLDLAPCTGSGDIYARFRV